MELKTLIGPHSTPRGFGIVQDISDGTYKIGDLWVISDCCGGFVQWGKKQFTAPYDWICSKCKCELVTNDPLLGSSVVEVDEYGRTSLLEWVSMWTGYPQENLEIVIDGQRVVG